MKSILQTGLLILGVIFLTLNLFAQVKEWKAEIARAGKTLVKSDLRTHIQNVRSNDF